MQRGLAPRHPVDVRGNALRPCLQHPLGPAGHVGGHEHMRQLLEGMTCRPGRTRSRGVVVPHVEYGPGNRLLRQRMIERRLLDNLGTGHVDQYSVGFIKASSRVPSRPRVAALSESVITR